MAGELARRFAALIRGDDDAGLEQWLKDATDSELASLAAGIGRDIEAVRAAITQPWSTSPVEGQINRLKTIKRQMYGRSGYPLLRNRLLAAARTTRSRGADEKFSPLHQMCGRAISSSAAMAMAIWSGSSAFQEHPGDQLIYCGRPNLLTERTAGLVAVRQAAVNGACIVGAAVAHGHPPSALAADRQALQQSNALAWRAAVAGLVSIGVVGEASLIGHELLPVNITRVCVFDANLAVVNGHLRGCAVRTWTLADRIYSAPTVDICAGIGRVVQNMMDMGDGGVSPHQLMGRRPAKRPHRYA